ncbi:MAG TPA: hypothetical protein VK508_14755 [Cyclobacteriaceae bacterium]|nr:hypothetical protein [Cyclobacteriaceae bacterium]
MLRPRQGTINVLGHVPHQRKPAFLQKIFMIPEEFHIPDISLAAFLKYYGQFYPMDGLY